MQANKITLLTFVFSFLVLQSGSTSTLMQEFLASIPEAIEEVDQVILKEFMEGHHQSKDLPSLLAKYREFKKDWVEKMVEFLIRELDIDQEGAKQARKNPESFHINFDTYKLFANSF